MLMQSSIHSEEAQECLFCQKSGVSLYRDLQDCLFRTPGTWALLHCRDCGLVWLDPRPAPADMTRLYEYYFTHEDIGPSTQTNEAKRIRSCKRLFSRGSLYHVLQRWLSRILFRFGVIKDMTELNARLLKGETRGKLLDVGCGSGQYLSRMRQLGWDVFGVELDQEATKVASQRYALRVHEGTLESLRVPENTFDAITMHHVIEHVWDPVRTLEKCYQILKPGGRLVLVTPNVKSLGHRFFGKAWRGLEVPRHLFLFSICTLRVCAERVGFQVLEQRSTARSAWWVWTASRLIRRRGGLPGGSPEMQDCSAQLEGIFFQLVEICLCEIADIGEELVLIATKPKASGAPCCR